VAGPVRLPSHRVCFSVFVSNLEITTAGCQEIRAQKWALEHESAYPATGFVYSVLRPAMPKVESPPVAIRSRNILRGNAIRMQTHV
jgi:hypothetical protein